MKYLNKKRFSMKQVAFLLSLVIGGIAVFAYASTVTIPNTFTPDTTISSSQMNSNFTALKDGIDQNKSVIACSDEGNFINTVTATPTDNKSVSITVPGSGNVLVSASGMFRVTGDGTPFQVMASVVDTSGTSDSSASNYWGAFEGGVPSGTRWDVPFHEQKAFTVAVAGTYTYYLTVELLIEPVAGGQVWAGKSRICAFFAPD